MLSFIKIYEKRCNQKFIINDLETFTKYFENSRSYK